MAQGASCGSPETSIVFGECAVSVVPSAAVCTDDISVVPGECGASLVPSEGSGESIPPVERGTTSVEEPGFEPTPPLFLQVSSTMYPTEAEDTIMVRGWFDENNSYVHQHYSSTIYPSENTDDMAVAGAVFKATLFDSIGFGPEYFTSSSMAVGGELHTILLLYSDWPTEYFTSSSMAVGGELRTILLLYSDWPTEYFTSSSMAVGGTLTLVLLEYQNWPTEYFSSSATVVGGTLT